MPAIRTVALSTDEQTALEALAAHGDPPEQKRARVVLVGATGVTDKVVSEQSGLSIRSVVHWRQVWIATRSVDALRGRGRGRPQVGDLDVAGAINCYLNSPPPAGRKWWSLERVASGASVGIAAVRHAWSLLSFTPRRLDPEVERVSWSRSDKAQVVGLLAGQGLRAFFIVGTTRPDAGDQRPLQPSAKRVPDLLELISNRPLDLLRSTIRLAESVAAPTYLVTDRDLPFANARLPDVEVLVAPREEWAARFVAACRATNKETALGDLTLALASSGRSGAGFAWSPQERR